jgi:ribosomal protein S18 acetylase RimI-like enzyme
MLIRPADKSDVGDIAGLALIAGEGIPAWFWQQSAGNGQDIEQVGATKLLSEQGNFSYRNVQVAVIDNHVAGMMLAYRLPDIDDAEDLDALPAFIRPMVELEQCVPSSFYINMLATFPDYRNMSIGTRLMKRVEGLASDAGCTISSIEVFDQNEGALRLYQRLGYKIIEQRPVVPHSSHPYNGNLLLLTRTVDSNNSENH